MSALPQKELLQGKMTVDQFLTWSSNARGRFELEAGDIIVMQSKPVEHAEVKFAIQRRLAQALSVGRVPGRVLPDGMTVRIDAETALEPDAIIYCGERLARGSRDVPNPVVVFEVSSPSTAVREETTKLVGYFGVASVMHNIIINPERPQHLHFARQDDDTILTRIVSGGEIDLDPPGIKISLDHLLDE